MKERSAGGVVYQISTDGNVAYLLLQPARGKPWGFAKGKINAGETERNAALREIAEETGLTGIELDPQFRHTVNYRYRRGRALVYKEVIYFLARAYESEVRISWEHVAYRWVGINQALEMVVFENAREILRKAHKYLTRPGAPAHNEE